MVGGGRGCSPEAARAVSVRPLVYSITHAAVSTDADVCLPAVLPSVVGPVVESAPVLSSHALSSSAVSPAVTGVARGSANIGACQSIGAALVEEATNSVSNLRPLAQPGIPADHPDLYVSTPSKVNSKKKAATSSKSFRTRTKCAPVFGKVKLKLQPSAGVSKNVSSSRAKPPSLTTPTGLWQTRRAISSGAHSCDVDDEEVLLTIPKTFKTGNPDSAASPNDR